MVNADPAWWREMLHAFDFGSAAANDEANNANKGYNDNNNNNNNHEQPRASPSDAARLGSWLLPSKEQAGNSAEKFVKSDIGSEKGESLNSSESSLGRLANGAEGARQTQQQQQSSWNKENEEQTPPKVSPSPGTGQVEPVPKWIHSRGSGASGPGE